MNAAELAGLGEEVGLDVVGATRVEPYEETERHIRERRARGLFADMRFTMARPEQSCHPETLLDGARTVVSAALCYWCEGEEPPPGHGRLPRYTWWDAYSVLRERLDELGERLGGEYRVLVDENQHVDREAAARSGVGFYGKNTMLITRRFGSWVVLGTLVTTAELTQTPPLDADCGSCTLCIDACPTNALDELGRRLGGAYRVLVDANQHVDREAAARSGVGFYGKNTMLITRRFGSWVVLGTLVTSAEVDSTPPLDAGCGSCTLCIDACPTNALDEPGVLDSTRCLSYWTQSSSAAPEDVREALGDRVYGCDICQDVCPWNRGVEKRRAGDPGTRSVEPHVSLADWLTADDDELTARYDRLFVPRNDPRYLRRNALVAVGNGVGDVELARPYAESDDPLLREHAERALRRRA